MLTQSQYDLLAVFRSGDIEFPPDVLLPDEYQPLADLKLISRLFIPGRCVWSITPAGLTALEQFEEVRSKHAKEERQQRFQNKISVASLLVSLITFFLGLIVEHYVGLVDLFRKIFQ